MYGSYCIPNVKVTTTLVLIKKQLLECYVVIAMQIYNNMHQLQVTFNTHQVYITCSCYYTYVGGIIVIVSTRLPLLTGSLSQDNQSNNCSLHLLNGNSITFVQLKEVQKYYANTPGVCDLVQKCLQVRNFKLQQSSKAMPYSCNQLVHACSYIASVQTDQAMCCHLCKFKHFSTSYLKVTR